MWGSLLSMERGGRTRRLWERLGEPGGGEGVASSMSSSEDTSPPMRRRSPMEIGPSLTTSLSWLCAADRPTVRPVQCHLIFMTEIM